MTLSEALTDLAYRLGENAGTSNSNEKARRTSFLIAGYRKALNESNWWFLQEESTLTTVSGQESYGTADGLPSDLRDIIEVRVDDVVYSYIQPQAVFSQYNNPPTIFNYDTLLQHRFWYMYEGKLHILPIPSATGTTVNIKYYKEITMPSADSDTFLVPDRFMSGVVAFAYGRVGQVDDTRANAADGYKEFDDMLKDLHKEQNRRKFENKGVGVVDPSWLVE